MSRSPSLLALPLLFALAACDKPSDQARPETASTGAAAAAGDRGFVVTQCHAKTA